MTNDVLEAGVVLHVAACTGMHHGVVRYGCSSLLIAAYSCILARILLIVVVPSTRLVRKVLRSLVFVRAAILFPLLLVFVPSISGYMRCPYVLKTSDDLVDVG